MNRLHLAGVTVLLVAASGAGAIAITRTAQVSAEARERGAALDAGPMARLTEVKAAPPERELVLQGESRPYASATIYAKVSGYVREMRVDKGDSVKKGDILAVLESPEVDRQYDAAAADAVNKDAIAKRATELRQTGYVSEQEHDVAKAAALVSKATLESYRAQRGYEVLRAPFDGTVTARFADPGALVQNASASQASALPVVTVSTVDRLRVYVYVDQASAAFVRKGAGVQINAPETPGQPLPATVTRVSGELDARTRMMLVEIDVDNTKTGLIPGGFVTVRMKVPMPAQGEVPSEALVFRAKQPYLAVISNDLHVHWKRVTIVDDDGVRVRLALGAASTAPSDNVVPRAASAAGADKSEPDRDTSSRSEREVTIGDKVALNLGDDLPEGAKVQVPSKTDSRTK